MDKLVDSVERRPNPTRLMCNAPCNVSLDLTPRDLFGIVTAAVFPAADKSLKLAWRSRAALQSLGLGSTDVGGEEDPRWEFLTGSKPEALQQMAPSEEFPGSSFSTNYTGFQFGDLPGQLGDGRCVTLCEGKSAVTEGEELPAKRGRKEDSQRAGDDRSKATQPWPFFELQVKGSSKTPFSRHLDGMYVRRTALREFIMSETLAEWGIPTARILAGFHSERTASRPETFLRQPTTVLVRAIPSSLRIGSFENCFYTKNFDVLRVLVKHAAVVHAKCNEEGEESEIALALVAFVARNVGRLVAAMQAAGFVHGTLNTDNVSIHGIVLDVSASDFITRLDPNLIVNTDDAKGRYAFGKQPDVGFWCVERMALAVSPMLTSVHKDALKAAVANYWTTYNADFSSRMLAKVGLCPSSGGADHHIVEATLSLLQSTGVNYHEFFYRLHHDGGAVRSLFEEDGQHLEGYRSWRQAYRAAASDLPRLPEGYVGVPAPGFLPTGAALERLWRTLGYNDDGTPGSVAENAKGESVFEAERRKVDAALKLLRHDGPRPNADEVDATTTRDLLAVFDVAGVQKTQRPCGCG